MINFQIRSVTEKDRNWIASLLKEHWGSARIVTRGKAFQGDELPGFIAVKDGKSAGLGDNHQRQYGRPCLLAEMRIKAGAGLSRRG